MIVASIDPVTNAGGDAQPAARHGRRAHCRRNWRAYGFYGGVYRPRSAASGLGPAGRPTSFPAARAGSAASTAIKGALGEPHCIDIRAYIEVDFRRLQEDRRHLRRRGHRRPVAGRGRPLPASAAATPTTSTSRAASSTWTGRRRWRMPARATRRRTSTAPNDSSASSRPCASGWSIPTSLLEPGQLEELVSTLKSVDPYRHPGRALPGARRPGRPRSTPGGPVARLHASDLPGSSASRCYSLTPKLKPIRRAVKNVFTVDKASERTRGQLGEEARGRVGPQRVGGHGPGRQHRRLPRLPGHGRDRFRRPVAAAPTGHAIRARWSRSTTAPRPR